MEVAINVLINSNLEALNSINNKIHNALQSNIPTYNAERYSAIYKQIDVEEDVYCILMCGRCMTLKNNIQLLSNEEEAMISQVDFSNWEELEI